MNLRLQWGPVPLRVSDNLKVYHLDPSPLCVSKEPWCLLLGLTVWPMTQSIFKKSFKSTLHAVNRCRMTYRAYVHYVLGD